MAFLLLLSCLSLTANAQISGFTQTGTRTIRASSTISYLFTLGGVNSFSLNQNQCIIFEVQNNPWAGLWIPFPSSLFTTGSTQFTITVGATSLPYTIITPSSATNRVIVRYTGTTSYPGTSSSVQVRGILPIVNGWAERGGRLIASLSSDCNNLGSQVAGPIATGSTNLVFQNVSSTQLTVSSKSNVIGSRGGSVEIEFRNSQILGSKGYIYLVFPRLYTIAGDSNNYCVVELGGITTPTVQFLTTVLGSLNSYLILTKLSSCILGSASCTSSFAPTACTMRVEYSYTSTIPVGSYIRLEVFSYNSPINYNDVNGFEVIISETVGSSTSGSEGRIEYIRQNGFVTFVDKNNNPVGLKPKDLSTGFINIKDSSGNIESKVAVGQSNRRVRFIINVDFPLLSACSLKIKFPDEIKLKVGETMSMSYLETAIGFLDSSSIQSIDGYGVSSPIVAQNTIFIKDACQSGTASTLNQGSITVGEIVSPSQVKDVTDFTVSLIDFSTGKDLAVGGPNQGYKIMSNNIQSGTIPSATAKIYPDDYTVNKVTDYTVEFVLQTNLYQYSQIVITLPQFVTRDNSQTGQGNSAKCQIISASPSTGITIAATPFICSQNSANQVTISGIFDTAGTKLPDFATNAPITFKIKIINAGRNPDSVKQAGTWRVVTENIISGQAYTVDAGTFTQSFETKPGTILQASITLDNQTTSFPSAWYTFRIKLANKISSNGQVIIVIPSSMSIASSPQIRSTCRTNKDNDATGNVQYPQTCSVSNNNITVILENGFDPANGHDLLIMMQGIQNPRNKQKVSNFRLETKDRALCVIDKSDGTLENSLFINMTNLSYLVGASVTPSNYTNGALSSYLVTIVSQYPLQSGDKIIMTYANIKPMQMSNPASSIPTGNLVVSKSSINSGDITVEINPSSQTSGGSFSFNLCCIINPPSTRTYQVFSSVLLKDSKGFDLMILSPNISVSVQTVLPANILTYSLLQSRLDYSIKTMYKFSFRTSNPINTTGSIVITWPVQVTKPQVNPSCTVRTNGNSQGNAACTFNDVTRSVIITNAFGSASSPAFNGTIDIDIDGFINPDDNRAINGFLIQTFDDMLQSFKIDKLEDDLLKPQTPCNYPCRQCSQNNRNFCQSCWPDTGLPYLMTLGQVSTCNPSCFDGYTSNGNVNKQCTKCDPSCSLCVDNGNIGDRSRCITCARGYDFRFTPLQQCLRSCSNGLYQSSPALCSLCSPTCLTCDKSASNCTSCNINSPQYRYLLDNQCIDSCPAGFTNVGAVCQRCDRKCATCNNSTSTCTSCDSSSKLKYFFGLDCLEKCPEGTNPDNQRLKCFGCLKGCKLCDSINQTKCLQCETPLLEYKGSCVKTCPPGTSKSFFGATCTSSFFINLPSIPFPHLSACAVMVLLTLISYMKDRRALIITNIIVFWGPIQLISYFSQIAFSYIYGTMNYAYTSAIAFVAYVILNVAFAIAFEAKIAKVDIEYLNWREHYSKTSKLIIIFSGLLSFKILRLHYSFLFGYDKFKATFDKPGVFQRMIIIFTVLHLIFSCCVILGVDIMGLISVKYGSQLFTTLVETAILSFVVMILEFIELCKLKNYLGDDERVDYDALVNQMNESMDKKLRQDMLKQIMNHVKANKDINLNNRLDELLTDMGPRRTKSMIDFGNDLEDDPRRTRSEPHSPRRDNDEFDRNTPLPTIDNVYAESKPADPIGNQGKTFSEFDSQVNPDDFDKVLSRKGGDFVQFDQQQADYNAKRLKNKNKKRGRKNQYYTQIDAEDDEEADNQMLAAYGDEQPKDDLGVIKEEEDDEDDKQQTLKQSPSKKKSSKPAPPVQQLDSDDIQAKQKAAAAEAEQQLKQKQLQEEALRKKEQEEKKELEERLRQEKARKDQEERESLERQYQEQMRKKEEELERERQRRQQQEEEEKKRKQLELEREILQKQEEERLRKEKEERERKAREEQEQKRLEEEIAAAKLKEEQMRKAREEEVKIPQDFSQQQMSEPIVQVPPDKEKRNFNENDILGDFDRDEKGNIIVLQDDAGNYIDKRGRPVNERGYLKDPKTGDIIENHQNQKMFDKKDIDERGEVPAPYCVEKYNFNPFTIRGDFDFDRLGKPIINKNQQGQQVDKRGRLVNKKGWLVDPEGNICDANGRKKFDKKQLTPEQDFPRLFNLNGRRFDVMDLCGQLQRDPNNGQLFFKKNQKGQSVDDLGRLVNNRGYLVDEAGNIIDKDKKKMFEMRYLKNGEFPKIFPFTKFNIKRIQGDFEMDPLGNPILDKAPNGDGLVDRQGKKVNSKGYYIDNQGNVIDQNGKLMFERDILDSEGDIPKVFRTGLLKSDSGSSLSRLMSEIEKNQPSEYGNPQWRRQQQQEQLRQQQRNNNELMEKLSGNTSVDSMMEDTPSNYNIANQRFDQTTSNLNAKSLQLQQQKNQQQMSTHAMNQAPSNNPMEMMDGEGSASGFDGDYAANDDNLMKKRRMKKKRKAAPVQTFGEPSDKDIMMAKAYGGVPKGAPKRVVPKNVYQRDTATPGSNINRNSKHQMSKVSGIVTGYNRDGVQQQTGDRHSVSMMQLEELKEDGPHFTQNNGAVNMTLGGAESNDASFLQVPEHHIREQRLKQKKMNELKNKNKGKRRLGGGDPDFEKMFGKDIDEFLEDSDWDIESFDNQSRYSKGTSRSVYNQDGRIRGLESIYLQRIETSLKKGGVAGPTQHTTKGKPKKVQAKFRPMQDRFISDPALMAALDNDNEMPNVNGSNLSQSRMARPHFVESAHTTGLAGAVSRTVENAASRQNAGLVNKTSYK